MRKKIGLLILLFQLFAGASMAQFRAGTSGIFVSSGTVLTVDGISLKPSSALQINDTEISRTATSVAFPRYKSINRSHVFSKAINFEGTAGFRFLASELNGNVSSDLRLSWSPINNSNTQNYLIAPTGQLSFSGDYVESVLPAGAVSVITAVSTVPNVQTLDITNYLTPNGDGVNDSWIIQNIQLYPGHLVKVFDRAGRVVYSKRDYDNSWDGNVNGAPLAESTYYYILTSPSGVAVMKGFVTLTRQ